MRTETKSAAFCAFICAVAVTGFALATSFPAQGGAAGVVWPLTAEGDLDMDQNALTNVASITNVGGTTTIGASGDTVDFPSGTTVDFTGATATGLPASDAHAGHVTFTPDGTYDIGSADGGVTDLRPRDVYIENALLVGAGATGAVADGDFRARGSGLSELFYDSSAAQLNFNNGVSGVVKFNSGSGLIESANSHLTLKGRNWVYLATLSTTVFFDDDYDTAGHFFGSGEKCVAEFSPYVEANTAGVGSPNVIAVNEARFFTNEAASALNYHSLPTAERALTHTFYVQDADGIRVTANTADTIALNGSVSSSAGYIESTTIGSWVTLTAINATEWVATGHGGDWSVYDGSVLNPATSLYGEMYLSTPASTTLTGTTPAKAAGTTTAGELRGFTHSNNRLTYDGIATHHFKVTVSVGVSKAAGSTELCGVHIYVDGATVNAQVDRTVSSSDEGSVSVSAIVTLATDSYVEIYLNSAGDDMTWESGTVTITNGDL